jgi:hypothetical protein
MFIPHRPIHRRSEIDSSTMKEDITITRAGRHYILRQNVRGQIVEFDRFDYYYLVVCHSNSSFMIAICNRTASLEDALLEVKKSKVTKSKEKGTDVELWCVYCVDDPSITMCAFCGCKVRLFQFTGHLLIYFMFNLPNTDMLWKT